MDPKNCLIIAATAREIEPFLHYYRSGRCKAATDIIITGVGLMAATYSITRQVALKRPHFMIQAGIAGSFDPNIPPGSLVSISKETVADLGVMENNEWKSMFDLGFMNPDEPPFQKGWLVNRHIRRFGTGSLKSVRAVTVNQVTTSPVMIRTCLKKYKPAVESMEGAALHYACNREAIPYLQIRAVSNFVGERDRKKWKIREAIDNLNKELIRITATL